MCKKNLENYTPRLTVVKGEESGWKHGSPCGMMMAGQGRESELVRNPRFLPWDLQPWLFISLSAFGNCR